MHLRASGMMLELIILKHHPAKKTFEYGVEYRVKDSKILFSKNLVITILKNTKLAFSD